MLKVIPLLLNNLSTTWEKFQRNLNEKQLLKTYRPSMQKILLILFMAILLNSGIPAYDVTLGFIPRQSGRDITVNFHQEETSLELSLIQKKSSLKLSISSFSLSFERLNAIIGGYTPQGPMKLLTSPSQSGISEAFSNPDAKPGHAMWGAVVKNGPFIFFLSTPAVQRDTPCSAGFITVNPQYSLGIMIAHSKNLKEPLFIDWKSRFGPSPQISIMTGLHKADGRLTLDAISVSSWTAEAGLSAKIGWKITMSMGNLILEAERTHQRNGPQVICKSDQAQPVHEMKLKASVDSERVNGSFKMTCHKKAAPIHYSRCQEVFFSSEKKIFIRFGETELKGVFGFDYQIESTSAIEKNHSFEIQLKSKAFQVSAGIRKKNEPFLGFKVKKAAMTISPENTGCTLKMSHSICKGILSLELSESRSARLTFRTSF